MQSNHPASARSPRRRAAVLAAVAGIALLAGGCGSDDNESSEATSSTPKQTFTGDPITVYLITGLKTAQYDNTTLAEATKAGLAQINAAGGIGGREVKLKTCNDTDANAELTCARNAGKDKAVAFLASSMLFNAKGALKELERSGIPSIAPLAVTQAEYAAPVNFPVTPTSFGALACPQQIAEATQTKSIAAISQDLAAQQELLKTLGGVAAVNKLKYSSVAVSVSETDFSASAQKLSKSGAEAVIDVLTPTAQTAFFTAIRSIGAKFKGFCTITNSQTIAGLKQLGADADGIYFPTALPATNEASAKKFPLVASFRKAMEGIEESVTATPTSAFAGWIAVEVFKQVTEKVDGELTAESLMKALNSAQVDLSGAGMPTVDFSKPIPAKGFERMFNPVVNMLKWDSKTGDLVSTDVKPANVLEIFGQLQAAAG